MFQTTNQGCYIPSPSCHPQVCPQKGWSKAKGITSCGTFARAAERTVPMPPWCNATAQRGSSQGCDVLSLAQKMWGSSDTSEMSSDDVTLW